ncbi:MAG: hypothetical protein EOL87_08290 [Spartobacteria bacterium]|nr:hypothetical protein [Spartobacteria bacterium]
MIDYETYCNIKHLHADKNLNVSQISSELQLNARTVTRYLNMEKFTERKKATRSSKLDPFRHDIVRLVSEYPFSAMQVLQKIRDMGYDGEKTIVRDYIASSRNCVLSDRF